MGSDLYVAVSGASARLRELDVVANNLANADTVGFKRDSALFEATLESALREPDGSRVAGPPGRAFVHLRGVAVDRSAGGVVMTGSPLDVAIDGPGFFEIETAAGPRYTRAGAFVVKASGELATPDGLVVAGESGPISVGDRPVRILPSGEVVDDANATLGRLRVVDFPESALLEKEGRNLLRPSSGTSPTPADSPRFIPGAIESSNVEPVHELARMVILHREFDIAMQVLQADDQATKGLIREVS